MRLYSTWLRRVAPLTSLLKANRAAARLSSTTAQYGPQPAFLRRNRRGIIWATASLCLGYLGGWSIVHTILPPPFPEPGSVEDIRLIEELNTAIDANFKVKVLRGKCTAAAASLRGEEGAWRELDPVVVSSPVVNVLSGQAMAGARGLGVQRLFWNQKTQELVAVVWFGGALTGWPGVAHGGIIATVLGDKAVLAASLARVGDVVPSRAGVLGPEPTEMELMYKKPTMANKFYVVRAIPRYGMLEGIGTMVRSLGREIEVEGQLETEDGMVCVEMRTVVPVAD